MFSFSHLFLRSSPPNIFIANQLRKCYKQIIKCIFKNRSHENKIKTNPIVKALKKLLNPPPNHIYFVLLTFFFIKVGGVYFFLNKQVFVYINFIFNIIYIIKILIYISYMAWVVVIFFFFY